MAAETFSVSFDSTSLPLRGREVPLRKTGIKFIELTCYENQTDPLPVSAFHGLGLQPLKFMPFQEIVLAGFPRCARDKKPRPPAAAWARANALCCRLRSGRP